MPTATFSRLFISYAAAIGFAAFLIAVAVVAQPTAIAQTVTAPDEPECLAPVVCKVNADGTEECLDPCHRAQQEASQCFFDPCQGITPSDTDLIGNACNAAVQAVSCTDPTCNLGACEVGTAIGHEVAAAPATSSSGGSEGDDSPTPPPAKPRVLGTTSKISLADRNAPDYFLNGNVPLIVEQLFFSVYGRKITHPESVYWKMRARTSKPTITKLRGAMQWHYLRGSTGVNR